MRTSLHRKKKSLLRPYGPFTPLVPQSRFGDKPVQFEVIFPLNGTGVLEGLSTFNFPLFLDIFAPPSLAASAGRVAHALPRRDAVARLPDRR